MVTVKLNQTVLLCFSGVKPSDDDDDDDDDGQMRLDCAASSVQLQTV